MNKHELRARRRAILDAMLLELSPSNVMIETEADEWLGRLEQLDREYSLSRQRPQIYVLVNQIDQLTRALLAVADTPHAQDSVCDTIIDAIVKFKTTRALDTAIAQFAAMDVAAFVSAEDAK